MDQHTKIRLIGYYTGADKKMKPEQEYVEKARWLAPLLDSSINSLETNPDVDNDFKNVIKGNTIFIFKDDKGNLYGFYTTEKIARITHVKDAKNVVSPIPLRYKQWFVPGEAISLIDEDIALLKIRKKEETLNNKAKSNSRSRENNEEVHRLKTRLRLENNQFIGQFIPERTEGWYKITDIRNTDFTKIEDKERGVKDLIIKFRSDKIFNRYAYYKFTWVLLETEPLKFGIDLRDEVVPLYPRDIVRCLHDSIIHYPASAAKKITRTLDTLNKQLTQSGKEVFIYELLQNANDYPKKQRTEGKITPIPIDVEFHITQNFLTFQHTGEYFNPKNIAAICDINYGEKSDNVEAIGYKGIGFKTVFLDNDYVYLNTGNYSFRFDKDATDVINTPWQILPVWTDDRTIHSDIKDIFSQHENDLFRVKFALQPRDKKILSDRSRKDNYINLFSNVFESERVILFIPNIQTVKVFFGNTSVPSIIRKKDTNDWCVFRTFVR